MAHPKILLFANYNHKRAFSSFHFKPGGINLISDNLMTKYYWHLATQFKPLPAPINKDFTLYNITDDTFLLNTEYFINEILC